MTRASQNRAKRSDTGRTRRGVGRRWPPASVGLSMAVCARGAPGQEAGQIETTQSALGTFSPWQSIGTGFLIGPTSVASDSAGTTLVGLGPDQEVYTSNSRDPGGTGGHAGQRSIAERGNGDPDK